MSIYLVKVRATAHLSKSIMVEADDRDEARHAAMHHARTQGEPWDMDPARVQVHTVHSSDIEQMAVHARVNPIRETDG